MNKKVIFGTAIFIIAGLFMFTFANPNEKVSKEKTSKQTVKEVSNETSSEESKKEETKKEETTSTNTSTPTTRRTTARRTTTTTTTTTNPVSPVVNPVVPQTPAQETLVNPTNTNNDAEDKAKKEAEELANYKDAAKKELAEYKKDENYSDINTAAVTTIKTDGSDAIDAAKTKDEVDQALQDAKDLIDALDTVAPVITVAEDEELYQKVGKANLNDYTVTDNVSAKDKISVTIRVTKDGKKVNEVNYNNVGTYAIAYTATDEAGNVATAVRNIKVKEVKAIELVLMAGEEDVTNATDSYWVNDPVKKISVYVKYNDGSTKKINKMTCNFILYICFDGYTEVGSLSTAHETFGNATVTYSYKGLKAKYNYNVKAKKVTSLEVTGNKAEYFQNEAFGITVTAKWNDGTEEVVTKYDISGSTSRIGKNQKAIITYKNASTSFKYDVIARSIVSINVVLDKDTYVQGQSFAFKKVIAHWNDGTDQEITGYTVSGNTNRIGNNQKGSVIYGFHKGDFYFNVIERKVESLEVTGNKATYIQNEAFNLTVKAKWNDGTQEVVTKYDISGNTKVVKNNQKAIITYKNASTSFTYDVIARKITSLQVTLNKDTYVKGQKIDIKSVVAIWNDGSEETITKYLVSGNTNVVADNQKGYVTYNGIKGEFKYNVIEKKVVSLSVTAPTNDYIKGEKFNLTVTAKWNDGSEEEVTNYTVSGDTNKVGLGQTATISYKGVTATYTYNVKYELHLVKHGSLLYLEFPENVNVKAIAYYDKKGNKSVIYQTGYNNKNGNKYYLSINQYNEMHSMKGQHDKQKLVVTDNNNAEYTYTKVVITNK